MNIKSTTYTAAFLASLLAPAVALPVAAFAQNQTPTAVEAAPAVKSAPPVTAPAAKPMARKPMSTTDRVEQHIKALHAQLRITSAQQSQWDQFAQVMRDNAKDMNQVLEQRRTSFATLNAADNMASYAQVAQQHAQDTQKLSTAFQALYGSLSDDQKKNADTVFRAHGDHGAKAKG